MFPSPFVFLSIPTVSGQWQMFCHFKTYEYKLKVPQNREWEAHNRLFKMPLFSELFT